MKNTHIMTGVIIFLIICICIMAGIILTDIQNSVNETSAEQQVAKETIDLSDTTITEWNNIQRTGNNSDYSDFQTYIDDYNTTYDLRNYKAGIISLDDYLNQIISFINGNPTGAGKIIIYKEYYYEYFDFVDESGDIAGETEYKCYSPQECYNITLFMADNSELEQIFGGDCCPLYDKYEYFCYLKCSYDSGEEAYAIFHNHQVILYYQNKAIMELFDKWFEGISG